MEICEFSATFDIRRKAVFRTELEIVFVRLLFTDRKVRSKESRSKEQRMKGETVKRERRRRRRRRRGSNLRARRTLTLNPAGAVETTRPRLVCLRVSVHRVGEGLPRI